MFEKAKEFNYYIQFGEEGKVYLKDKDTIWKKDKDYIFIPLLLLSGNKEKLIEFFRSFQYNEEDMQYFFSISIKYSTNSF